MINQLARELKQGNQDAISTLYESTHKQGISIAKQYVATLEDAEDAFQEGFLRALSNIDKWDENRSFLPWLHVVIVNTAKNIAAKKDNRAVTRFTDMNARLSEDSGEEYRIEEIFTTEDSDVIPEEALDIKEMKDIMNHILSSLPDEQRQAIFLYYYKELSIKEIADIQEVSDDTVKSRLNYARKKIKTGVEDYEKKSGIRLHSFIPFTLLVLFCKTDVRAAELSSMTVASGMASGMGATASTVETVTSSAPVKTGMAIGTKIGIGIGIAVLSGAVGIGTAITITNRDQSQTVMVEDVTGDSNDAVQEDTNSIDEKQEVNTQIYLEDILTGEDEIVGENDKEEKETEEPKSWEEIIYGLYDNSITFPEDVIQIRPDKIYKATSFVERTTYIDPNTDKTYCILTFKELHVDESEFLDARVMMPEDAYFYQWYDDGRGVFFVNEDDNDIWEKLENCMFTVKGPENERSFDIDGNPTYRKKWNGLVEKIEIENGGILY